MRFGMHSQNSHLLVPAIKCSLKVIRDQGSDLYVGMRVVEMF